MKILDINLELCSGCTACVAICTAKAITMQEDAKGFLYPKLHPEKCISCGLCYQVCCAGIAKHDSLTHLKAYAIKNKDITVRMRSSSGGFSHGICRAVLEKGGVVFGVQYDAAFHVVMDRAETLEECVAFYGSKYVQADLKDTFQEVEEELRKKRWTLFIGTSCHVAGLVSFLDLKKCQTETLITVDFVCHGEPSPRLFAEYISFLRKNKHFQYFDFRTKEKLWGDGSANYGCTIYYKNNCKETDTAKARIFLNLFFSNNFLRPNCFHCAFASVEKPSDITMADFWGLKEDHSELFDEYGVSAVLVHTEKGELILKEATELEIVECEVKQVMKKQANLSAPSLKPSSYNEAWKQYEESGFMAISRRWGGTA